MAIEWPPQDRAYTDEFGLITADTYAMAGELWAHADSMTRQFTRNVLNDEAEGLRLMLKAAAQVTQQQERGTEPIRELKSYLSVTYRRLILAKSQQNAHHCKLNKKLSAVAASQPGAADLAACERRILLQQIRQRMDNRTKQVFDWLRQGYSFDEIGCVLGQQAAVVRRRFQRAIKRLQKQLGAAGGISTTSRHKKPPRKKCFC